MSTMTLVLLVLEKTKHVILKILRIVSGQIEEINAERAKQKCKSRSCRAKKEREMKPELKELSPAVVEFVRN